MSDLIVQLGDFVFKDSEIPERMPFGGDQTLVVHKQVGGGKVIDSMGRDDAPMVWSGIFLGQTALQRARYLDNMRVEGKPVKLTWHEFSYSVLVHSYHADFDRYYKIPYQITCEVLADLSQPVTSFVVPGLDNAFGRDLQAVTDLVNAIADSPLIAYITQLAAAMSQIPGLGGLSREIMTTIINPIHGAQERVGVLIGATDSVLIAGSGIGGASSLTSQSSAFNTMGSLLQVNSLLGRMSANLGTTSSGVKSITVAGGNLFDVAAKEFGNAMAWTGIANANGLTDPSITGVQTLQIPAQADNSDGVLTI